MEAPKRVLVIDDEEIIRRCSKRTLGPAGYLVDTASNGREGLALANENRYDLVLVDLKMPEMDGTEVVKHIRQISPNARIVVITGYTSEDTSAQVTALGAAFYLEKPYTPQSLLDSVERVLG